MRRLGLMFLFFTASLGFGQKAHKADAVPQTPKPKLAQTYVNDARNPTFIQVDGIWEPDNPTERNKLIFSVVRIKCFRHGGTELVGSDPFCLVATATPIAGITISVDTDFLKVIEWNAKEIITVDDSPECIISQNTFDLASRTVSGMDIRKPKAKGFDGLCTVLSDRQTYYLRDKVDYGVNHRPVEK